jgi:hypothetical protein
VQTLYGGENLLLLPAAFNDLKADLKEALSYVTELKRLKLCA